MPDDRLQDAHDVLGTYDLVSNLEKRQRVPAGRAEQTLEETNAFLTPETAEERGVRLELPA